MGNYDGPLSDRPAGLKFEPQIGLRDRSKRPDGSRIIKDPPIERGGEGQHQ
jgi:hypothetical protein